MLVNLVRVTVVGTLLLTARSAALPAQTTVAPDGASATAPENTPGNQAVFTVHNDGFGDWFSFVCDRTGAVTACTPPANIWIGSGGTEDVTVTFTTGAAGTGTVTMEAWGLEMGGDDGWYDVTVEVPVVAGSPVVDLSPYFPEKRDYGLCAVPACFGLMYAQSTVPYFSLDTPRNLTLVYNSDRVDPKPFVHVDVKRDPNYAPAPDKFQVELRINGTPVQFANTEYVLNFANPPNDGQFYRMGGQFNVPVNYTATGVYPMQILIHAVFGGSLKTTTINTLFVQVNEASSSIARGWTLGGIQRLYPVSGGVLITEGNGSHVYFPLSGGAYVSPAGEFSKVTQAGSGWTRAYPDSTRVTFNSAGRMTQLADRFNNVTAFDYDASLRLWRVRDPLNLNTTLAYGSYGLATITDHFGRVTQLAVPSNRTLTSFKDPDNVSTGFTYDGSLRLWKVTDRRGFTTEYNYATFSGQLWQVKGPAVYTLSYGMVTPTTTFESWDVWGSPWVPTNPTSFVTVRGDSAWGRVTDPEGHATRFAKLNRVRQAHETHLPNGQVATALFTTNYRLRYLGQSIGGIDSIGYDAGGLPVYTDAAGIAASYATRVHYGGWAQPDSIWGTSQERRRFFLGANGRVDSVQVGTSGSVHKTRYRYDVRGRDTLVTDASNHQLGRNRYLGANGNLSQVIEPGGRTTTYGHDTYGRVTSIAQTGVPARTIQYDLLNRQTAVYDGVNPNPTSYQHDLPYDADEYIALQVTDPKGQVYKEFRNPLGWVTTYRDPTSRDEIFWYDRDGLVKRRDNRRGQAVSFTYDNLHRLTWKGGPIEDAGYSYSADGRVITGSTATTSETRYLNVRGQPDSVKTRYHVWDYWRRYGYTPAGLLDSVWASGVSSPPFQTRKYSYNTSRGTLDSIRVGGLVTQVGLNADLLAGTVTFPGGDQVTRGFTSSHGEMSITTTAAFGNEIARILTYGSGRLWRDISEPGGWARLYGYDGLGRLKADTLRAGSPGDPCPPPTEETGAECPNFYQTFPTVLEAHAFQYDSAGNRRDNDGTYATGNRITGFAGCQYSTDYDGNVTVKYCPSVQLLQITWAADHRPSRIVVNEEDTLDLEYDAFDRLAVKKVNGVVDAYYLWDGDQLFAELYGPAAPGLGETKVEYSYYPGLDHLHAILVEGTHYYAHADGLGSVIALTDTAGAVQRTYTYDAWGQLASGSDFAGFNGVDRARFKGALWLGPEVDLYYMRNRWYEPKTGRFLSEDPIWLDGGINLYAFAGNDPVNAADPTGLQCQWVAQEAWVPNKDGDGLERKTVLVRICSDGTRDVFDTDPSLPPPFSIIRDLVKSLFTPRTPTLDDMIWSIFGLGVTGRLSGITGHYMRQLARHGRASLLRSLTSHEENLAYHLRYLEQVKAVGGYATTIERTIRTRRHEIEVIKRLLGIP